MIRYFVRTLGMVTMLSQEKNALAFQQQIFQSLMTKGTK